MQIGEIQFHVTGDIGGIGVSRFRFARQDAANITGADCNAAAAAANAMMSTLKIWVPQSVTWTAQSQVNIYESTSGLVQGPLVLTSVPSAVTGSGTGNYGAGVGARVNWKTATLSGRRLIKGALFIVPMSQNAYTGSGAIQGATTGSVNSAAATYLTAMTTAQLYPIVWHRPKKGAQVGGITGIVFAGICSSVPAGLRSRRS